MAETKSKKITTESHPHLSQDEIDQHNYDVTRTAIQDDRQDQLEERKPEDILVSENPTDGAKELSITAIEVLKTNFFPTLEHRVIGNNEYLLLPKRRLAEIPKGKTINPNGQVVETDDVKDEILRLHGDHIYRLPNARGEIDEYSEEVMAIPLKTLNTTQLAPDAALGIHTERTHDDLWAENLELDQRRLGYGS